MVWQRVYFSVTSILVSRASEANGRLCETACREAMAQAKRRARRMTECGVPTMGRITATLAVLSLIGGCHGWVKPKKTPTSAPVFTAQDDFGSPEVRARMPSLSESYRQTPLVAPPTPSLPVERGSLPLVYLVGQSSTVRVVDESNQSVIASQAVVANTLIAVDQNRGVSIGGDRVMRDALPQGHAFSIYVDTESGPSVFMNGTIRPSVPIAPTTRSVER